MANQGNVDIHDSEYAQFLKKLAYDDDFRARLEENPRKVLAEHAVDLDEDDLPAKVKLPPKEEIQARFDELLSVAAGYSAQMAFLFFWRWR